MANEAVIIELSGANPIRFTVSGATTIAKGTLCTFGDPRTAIASSADGQIVAGIAASEKSSSSGTDSETLAFYVPGQHNIFDLVCSNAVTLGYLVAMSGNTIRLAVATDVEQGKVLGKALETGSDGERIAVLV